MTTTEPQPLTPAAIQTADTSLDAYLQARAGDFEAHGWKDGGVIEARGGRTLQSPHIDITLSRARGAERERDQARAENALLRRTLDKILRNFYEKGHPGEPCLRSGWVPVRQIEEARDLLTAVGAPPPQDATQPDADGRAGAPAGTEPSNWSSPPQDGTRDAGAMVHYHSGGFRSACGLTRQEDLELGLDRDPDAVTCPRCLEILAGWAKTNGRHADA